MLEHFFDPTGGGFFDVPRPRENGPALGVLGTRRKPFQDSPTPAGNPMAIIALLRLHSYTNEAGYREKAEHTLEVLAGSAAQYGVFAATYGIAAEHFVRPHTQVVILGSDALGDELYHAATAPFFFGKAVLRFSQEQWGAGSLPPALAESISHLPSVKSGTSLAVICSNFSCQPPTSNVRELERSLQAAPVENHWPAVES
jgi:uncharacterized protein